MTTTELKQYIDKVLGNNIRCLLPSYWWKRLFTSLADRVDEVEQSALEVAEASKMPIVASEKELNKLDLPKGSIAAVEISERSFSECYLPETTENFNTSSLTKIEEIVVKGGSAPTRNMGLFILVDVDITENLIIEAVIDANNTYAITATYRTVGSNLTDSFILELNGKPYSAGLRYFNALLKEKSFYYGGYDGSPLPADVLAFVDAHLAWKSEGSDLYIKGASWERFAKESDVDAKIIFVDIYNNKANVDNAKAFSAIKNCVLNGKPYIVVGGTSKLLHVSEGVMFVEDACSLSFRGFNYNETIDGTTKRKFYTATLYADGHVVLGTAVDSAIDSKLSDTSENPVQNKAIKAYIDNAIGNTLNTPV